MKIPKELEQNLKAAPVDFKAGENLLKRARKDLASAKIIRTTDPEAAYTLLYDCMLHAGLAYMMISGVRPELPGKHKTIIRYLGHAFGEGYESQIEFYDRMRRKRHVFLYEPRPNQCTEKEVDEAKKVASEFLEIILRKLRQAHPQREFEF